MCAAVTASWAIICLAQRAQVDGQVAGGGQGVGVVLAQDGAAAVEGVLIQVPGGLYSAEFAQVVSQDGGGGQSVAVVLAQDAAVTVEGVLVQVPGGLYVAQLAQADGQVVGGVEG